MKKMFMLKKQNLLVLFGIMSLFTVSAVADVKLQAVPSRIGGKRFLRNNDTKLLQCALRG